MQSTTRFEIKLDFMESEGYFIMITSYTDKTPYILENVQTTICAFLAFCTETLSCDKT